MVRAGHYRFGVATVLGFDCLMRINEFMSLRAEDVVDGASGNDYRLGVEYRKMSIRIKKAKTGVNQSVDVEDEAVAELIRSLLRFTRPNALLFGSDSHDFYTVFKACCADLGLVVPYVPHSLRHGGATRLHLRGVPIDDILRRGRWQGSKSARIYIQSTKAVSIAITIPDHLKSISATLASDLALSFAHAASSSGSPSPHAQ